jgi:hypothetical protein
VIGGFHSPVERGSDFGEVDGSDFQERDDESGDEVEPVGVEGEVGLQGVLDGFTLHSATSLGRDSVAAIVSDYVVNGKTQVLSGSQTKLLTILSMILLTI